MALSVVQEKVPEIASEQAITNSSHPNADVLTSRYTVAKPNDDAKETLQNCWTFDTKNQPPQPNQQHNRNQDKAEVDTLCNLKIHSAMHPPAAALVPQGSCSMDHSSPSLTFAESLTGKLKPRLTLSAFRGPAANITQTDPLRKLQDYYDLQRSSVLGHGAFSTVRLAVQRSDSRPVAVKSIAKHEALRSKRLRPGRSLEEWQILKNMQGHPFVVQLLDIFETDEEIQLVLEYCKGGELFNAIQRKRNRSHAMRRGQYTEQQAACIMSQLLRALADLHARGIVHRDVKLENILLASDDENSVLVKLCDFGMARSLIQSNAQVRDETEQRQQEPEGNTSPLTPGRSRSNSSIGGSYYAAPEICYGGTYDTAVDMYSLGVTLYIVLCGFPPVFAGPEADQVIMFPNSYWKDISQDAMDLVRKMLNPDASLRITAHEALRDRWIWKHRRTISQALSPAAAKSPCAETKSGRQFNPVHNASKNTVNLDMVRRRLSKTLVPCRPSPKRRASVDAVLMSPKRQRLGSARKSNNNNNTKSASSALIALADLYRDVAQSPSAKVISSVVEHNAMEGEDPFKRSPFPTLSV